MNDVLTAISTVGFPIVMCGGLAWFVYKFTQAVQQSSQKREDSLMAIVSEQSKTLQQIADVLGNISARLERVENILEETEESRCD